MPNLAPVSYTHLDLVGQHGLGQVAAEDGGVRQDAVQLIGDGLGLAELDAGKLGPVSYTHLDVYKRQRL